MGNYNPFTLKDKTILITGASSGIGRAIAIECSRMGANVIITGRNEERLQDTFEALEHSNLSHQRIIADLCIQDELVRLISQLPKLDGIVLSAGIGIAIPVSFSTIEKMKKTFETNFFTQTELLRIVFKKKILNKQASVVSIASIGGNYEFAYGHSIYGASKAALRSMMKSCAKEFATRQIRVNCICPGMVETPLIHHGTITEEQLQADMNRYPLKRYGKPEEIAYSAIFLLSDASSWMTGQDIVIDGGITI